jgi:2-oxoisovalerate dehydrogenase E1 component alpha subunit
LASKVRVTVKSPGLASEELLQAYSQMLLARAVADRVWALNRQGKVAIVGSCHGHEAAQVGAVWALDRARDLFFLYYRDMAGAIALGVTARELLLGFMAKAEDPFSGGRQFPLHGAYPARRIINSSNVVASNVPHAVGAALAAKLRRESTVVLCCFGDGATSEGEWHEALNFAGIHRLPVIFLCENNGLAISVPTSKQMAVGSVADRAVAYGFPGTSVDGCDVQAVYEATRQAAQRAREGGGPTLIEARVVRLMPHTTDDDHSKYRSPGELEEAQKRDPLPLLRRRLLEQGLLAPETDEAYQQRAQEEVDQATDYADAAPFPDPSTLMEHLYGSAGGG